MSPYEKRELKKIHQWKNPPDWSVEKVLEVISWPFDRAGDLIMNTPVIGGVIEKSVSGIINLSNDIAQWSINPEDI